MADMASNVPPASAVRVKLLSYNIQAGIASSRYRHYVTRSWRHLVPHRERLDNLNCIAELASSYDLVGLQEVDAGSLRSGFLDLTEYLAQRGGFPHWYHQVNRDVGVLAQNSNGFLSRFPVKRVENFRLPAGPGRGAMLLDFEIGGRRLEICIAHLALSTRAQRKQLDFLADLILGRPNLVLMGDFNCDCDSAALQALIERTGLRQPNSHQNTFPSWRPIRRFDHILVSDALKVLEAGVVDYALSDHLPLAVELELAA